MNEQRKPLVIVGVSRSLSGLQALRVAVAEARSTGAQLWAVRSWREPAGWGRPPIWQFYDEVTQEVTAELRDAFAMAMGGLPADVAVRPLVLAGEPGQTLISVADRDDDLIVVGAGTRRGLGRGGRWRGTACGMRGPTCSSCRRHDWRGSAGPRPWLDGCPGN